MISFQSVGRVVNDRRNWPVIIISGAAVFIGSQLFEAFGLDSAVWIITLIAIIAMVARSFIKTSPID